MHFFFFFGIHVLFDPRMNPTYLFEQQYPTCVLMENWLNELYNIQTMNCFTTMKRTHKIFSNDKAVRATFEEHWSDILYTVPQLEQSSCHCLMFSHE